MKWLGLLFLVACTTAPEVTAPRGGEYTVTDFVFTNYCLDPVFRYERDSILVQDFVLFVAQAVGPRGIFDSQEGELLVQYGGKAQPVLLSPMYGSYLILKDTLYVSVNRNDWLNAVPFAEWRDGMIRGVIRDDCVDLAIQFNWTEQ